MKCENCGCENYELERDVGEGLEGGVACYRCRKCDKDVTDEIARQED